MYNKFPGKDITEEDINSKIPLVANFSKEPFEIAGVVLMVKRFQLWQVQTWLSQKNSS